jgi:predicted metal-dependent hydrolase
MLQLLLQQHQALLQASPHWGTMIIKIKRRHGAEVALEFTVVVL